MCVIHLVTICWLLKWTINVSDETSRRKSTRTPKRAQPAATPAAKPWITTRGRKRAAEAEPSETGTYIVHIGQPEPEDRYGTYLHQVILDPI